jgi:hypothetical protein
MALLPGKCLTRHQWFHRHKQDRYHSEDSGNVGLVMVVNLVHVGDLIDKSYVAISV